MTDSPLLQSAHWADNTITYRVNLTDTPPTYDAGFGVVRRTSGSGSEPYDNTPEGLSGADAKVLRAAMDLWSRYVDVTFQLTTSSGPDLYVIKDTLVEYPDAESVTGWSAAAGLTRYPSGSVVDYAVVLYDSGEFDPNPASDGFNTVFHELGHVLGLKDGSVVGGLYDSIFNTVMALDSIYPLTPMIYDLQALHQRFGETGYNAGPTTYGEDVLGDAGLWTIWDADGIDTIEFSWAAVNEDAVIDLRGGTDEYGARLSHIGSNTFAIGFDVVGNISGSGVVDIENVIAGNNPDKIFGGYVGNAIFGMGGNDTLVGYSGGDVISGGDNDDVIYDLWWDAEMGTRPTGLTADNDALFGDAGNDTIYGQDGFNFLLGGEGNDTIYISESSSGTVGGGIAFGDKGNDKIYLGSSTNVKIAIDGEGVDSIHGGNLSDTIFGHLDNERDFLYGEGGDDVIFAGVGDVVNGGDGNDTIIVFDERSTFTGPWTELVASSGNDKIIIVNPKRGFVFMGEGGGAGDTLWFGDQDLTNWEAGDTGVVGVAYNIGQGFVVNTYEDENTAAWVEIYSANSLILFDQIFQWTGNTPTAVPLSSVDNYDGAEIKIGSDSADTLTGGSGNDAMFGGAGADSLTGGGGNDMITGGAGNDFLSGSTGDDVLQSDDLADTIGGADTVSGGDGNDYIETGAGSDSINAGEGRDIAYAAAGNDTLRGYGGEDLLDGGDGDDRFYGGLDNDTVNGGAGADTVNGEEGNDRLEGKDGSDLLYGDDGDDAAYGDDGNDRAYGGNGLDRLYGWTGNDSLWGEADADLIVGDAGLDSLDGGAGNDTIYGGDDHDELLGGDGDDQLFADAGNDSVTGGNGHDLIYGWSGNDTVDGQAGNDTISGEDGSDSLTGYTGDDVIFGGAGNDSLLGASGNDYSEGGDGNDYISSYKAP